MDNRFDGVVVITGGGGGAAGGIAEAFRDAGARIVLAGRRSETMQRRAAALDALAIEGDLADPAGASRVVSGALAAHGRLDALIHAAGGFAMGAAHESGMDAYDRMFDINVRTLHAMTGAVLPVFLRQDAGFLAGFSSGAVGGGGAARMTLYAAAKAAVELYLLSLRKEVAGTGIRVAVVTPLGAIDTPANRRDMPDADWRSWIDPREIGRALVAAAAQGDRGRLLDLALSARD